MSRDLEEKMSGSEYDLKFLLKKSISGRFRIISMNLLRGLSSQPLEQDSSFPS